MKCVKKYVVQPADPAKVKEMGVQCNARKLFLGVYAENA